MCREASINGTSPLEAKPRNCDVPLHPRMTWQLCQPRQPFGFHFSPIRAHFGATDCCEGQHPKIRKDLMTEETHFGLTKEKIRSLLEAIWQEET